MADSGTISRIGGILKTVYSPAAIVDQQNKATVSRKRYGKASDFMRAPGDHFEFGTRVAGARGSIAASASDDALPAGTYQNDQKFQVFDRAYFGRIPFFEKDLENAKAKEQAFANHMEESMSQFIEDFEKIINIDFVAGDSSGILSTIAANSSGTTLTLAVGTSFGQWGAKYIQEGSDIIDVYDSTLTTSRTAGAGVKVNSVTAYTAGTATTSIVVASAVAGVLIGDIVVRGGGRVNKSYASLFNLTDDSATTFQGLSRSTFPILKGNHLPMAGQPLLESTLQQANSAVEAKTGQGVDEWLVSQAQWDAYVALSYAQKRFNDADSTNDRGFTKCKYNGKDFIKEVDVPPSVVYGLTKDTIKFGQVSALGWMDKDGDILGRVPGFAKYEAILREFGNFCFTRPNANVRIDGLSFPLSPVYIR